MSDAAKPMASEREALIAEAREAAVNESNGSDYDARQSLYWELAAELSRLGKIEERLKAEIALYCEHGVGNHPAFYRHSEGTHIHTLERILKGAE